MDQAGAYYERLLGGRRPDYRLADGYDYRSGYDRDGQWESDLRRFFGLCFL